LFCSAAGTSLAKLIWVSGGSMAISGAKGKGEHYKLK